MEPLYRFKLNDNGQIETRVIDTYEETGAFWSTNSTQLLIG